MPIVTLNQHYKTSTGRILRSMHFVLVYNQETGQHIHSVKLLENIPSEPLPKMHIQPTELVDQLILSGRMIPVPFEK